MLGSTKLWSPNAATNKNVGGTIIKFGKYRFDVEAGRGLHVAWIMFGRKVNHIYHLVLFLVEYLEEFRMIVKPYKLNKSFVELLYDFSDEKNYDILINIFKIFNLQIAQLVCSCVYDDKKIALSIVDDKVKVGIEKKRPLIYSINNKEFKVSINSDFMLKQLLEISNNYDVMLSITPIDKITPNVIINDNGHDYINFDKNEFNVQVIIEELNKLL